MGFLPYNVPAFLVGFCPIMCVCVCVEGVGAGDLRYFQATTTCSQNLGFA